MPSPSTTSTRQRARAKSPRPARAAASDRLNCRISPAIKQQAEEAAHLLGQSITAFTEAALAEKAQGILERQERIVLSERDFARFVEVINNPRPAGPALKRAAEQYKAVSLKHPDANW
jgi:uncharacterized protein (DUF1778 family)